MQQASRPAAAPAPAERSPSADRSEYRAPRNGTSAFVSVSLSKEIGAAQAERLGQSIAPLYCSELSLAHTAQAERDNESCFFVRAGSRRSSIYKT
ncbi:hypothetical protein EVAR_37389_1 [Eumeta japonica]|uniref:Uncharacterized protein n=1 Tax=Eumeta variegata TaxID=151549 RepID=A0A4C1ZTF6_EUMVA|nr:hypothetical protein EVAR_37389_1 [Eumeta japonica]